MTTSTDIWDQAPSTSSSSNPIPRRSNVSKTPVTSVKDDWEDDDDDDDEETQPPTGEKNKQIWEDANTKPHHPMPDLILSRNTSLATPAAHLPPQGVFQQQPTMHILRRPSNSPSNASFSSANNDNTIAGGPLNESLKDREARYHVARDRIFNNGNTSLSDGNGSSEKVAVIPAVKVLREPRGPNEIIADGSDQSGPGSSQGFGGRKPKLPASNKDSKTKIIGTVDRAS